MFSNNYFVSTTNTVLASLSLPWIPPIKNFRRNLYARESEGSSTLAQFRYNLPPICHKYPRVRRMSVQRSCPLCPCLTPNNSSHLALFCPYVEDTRRDQTSISMFRNSCIRKGYSEQKTFQLFINGLDWNENPVETSDYLQRGRDLELVMNSWLSLW